MHRRILEKTSETRAWLKKRDGYGERMSCKMSLEGIKWEYRKQMVPGGPRHAINMNTVQSYIHQASSMVSNSVSCNTGSIASNDEVEFASQKNLKFINPIKTKTLDWSSLSGLLTDLLHPYISNSIWWANSNLNQLVKSDAPQKPEINAHLSFSSSLSREAVHKAIF